MPDVSIIIPCFNDGAFLRDAIASADAVLKLVSGEVIVINDGSTDSETLRVLSLLPSPYIKVISTANQGLAAARNVGVSLSSAKYVIPLDADNLLIPEFVPLALGELESDSRLAVVYGDRLEFGLRERLVKVSDFHLRRILIGNYIDACAIIRKSALNQVGGYDEHMPVMGCEDWDLWIRMGAENLRFMHLDSPGFRYRVRECSMTYSMSSPPNVEQTLRYLTSKHYKVIRLSLCEAHRAAYHFVDTIDERMLLKFLQLARRCIRGKWRRWFGGMVEML